jgi:Ser/Thr protein kinase RdoA (MazF antagonist)
LPAANDIGGQHAASRLPLGDNPITVRHALIGPVTADKPALRRPGATHLTAIGARASVVSLTGLRRSERTLVVLNPGDVAPYLIDRKLLSARAVVDGGLHVDDQSRLNRVFVVTAEGERSLVLKTAGKADRVRVAREAAVLERLRSVDERGRLASFLPNVVAYDDGEGVLVLEAAPRARDLGLHHASGRFSCALARETGRALARLHAVRPSAISDLQGPTDLTWSLRVHEPDLDSLRTSSAAALELTRMIQATDDFRTALDALIAAWTEEAVIHGDVRWDNCLAWRSADSDRWTRLQLIDWEVCGVGDPGWDLGAFLAEYLRAWLRSIPIADPQDPARLIAHAVLPLRRMRPAMRAFWESYTRHRGPAIAEPDDLFPRAIRFTAVRLLTSALEEAQTLTELRASSLLPLSLSQSILRRPREAAGLFGL